MKKNYPIVNTHNEWDPLEEIIVGTVEGATIPPWEPVTPAVVHHEYLLDFYRQNGGKPWAQEMLDAAQKDIDEFVHILEAEGITVRRPSIYDISKPFSTPDFESQSSVGALMPRDVLLVIGDQIIEAPMGWRSRYHENYAYKDLCKEYSQQGARWMSAPRPQLSDASFEANFIPPTEDEPMRTILTEYEPLFDAADAIKCGKDIFVAQSSCCNRSGIDWIQQHLGDEYRVHEVEVFDTHPMHIDATFYPLAPGKLLINPERIKKVPEIFKNSGWDILVCPEPNMPDSHPMYTCSKWLNMNVLMLDEERVIVSKGEDNLIKAFKDWGFKPIECNFYNFESIAGGLHCATVDIRRRGELQSYF
ncbi:MAG: amidinotransferase [Anaerolineae bacterium]|jgi:glycine amidinotransferase|nr:amidinotransferase [Anaerolineae bacterium]MBT7191389.1 amidinotransferase [Anaerolineae bacterium]MBT7989077.1 amidinotransferase [Anaerolineae bacterium]